jgi:transposase
MSGSEWLSDEAWAAIEPQLPKGRPGAHRVDDRRVISGILHVLRSGCRWRDRPPEYGPATTIYNRYNRWSARGIWNRIFERLATAGNIPDEISIDSTHVKAHRSAAGAKKGAKPRRRSAAHVVGGTLVRGSVLTRSQGRMGRGRSPTTGQGRPACLSKPIGIAGSTFRSSGAGSRMAGLRGWPACPR